MSGIGDTKISGLPTGVDSDTTEAIAVVQGGVTKQLTIGQLLRGLLVAGAGVIKWMRAGGASRTVDAKLLERVSLLDFPGADPTGATDSTAALAAFVAYIAANATRCRGIFPTGIYLYSTSPNFAVPNAEFVAEGEVRLRYTGTGSAVIFDALAGNISNVRFLGNFIVEALSTAAHAIYSRGIHRSTIEARVRGCGSAAAGLYVIFCVCTTFRVRVTGPTEDSWYSASPPLNGYYITNRAAGENTSGCSFYPIVENVAGDGIVVGGAVQNQFFGGTSEDGTGTGIVCTSNSSRNSFFGTDVENNASAVSDAGFGNRFYSIIAGTPGAGVSISGNLSTHVGGFYDAIVDNGVGTSLDTIVYGNNGGAISGTGVGRTKRSVLNGATGKFDADQSAETTISLTSMATGSPTTVLTLPSTGNAVYHVAAYLAGAGSAASYGAIATIYQDEATSHILSQVNGTAMTIALAGQAVQVTQASGVTQTVTATMKPV